MARSAGRGGRRGRGRSAARWSIAAVFASAVAQARATAPGVRETQQVLAGSVKSAEATTNDATARRNALAAQVDAERRSRLEGDERGQQLLGSLDQANFAAAATPVIGPGLTVTVTDPGMSKDLSDVSKERVAGSRQVILDRDLQLVVNSLWVSGAEAISVGGVRIGPNVTIRQAGGGILVDNQPISSPYVILAVGPPHAMAGCVRPQPRPAAASAAGDQLRRRGHCQRRRRPDAAGRFGSRYQLRQADWALMTGRK